MMENIKLDLVRSIMQLEGNCKLDLTCHYKADSSVKFSGYQVVDGETKEIKIVMDKNQIEAINECESVSEIYECYKEMQYF